MRVHTCMQSRFVSATVISRHARERCKRTEWLRRSFIRRVFSNKSDYAERKLDFFSEGGGGGGEGVVTTRAAAAPGADAAGGAAGRGAGGGAALRKSC